jgi:hypothetical protein
MIDENNMGIGSYKINEEYSTKTYLLFIRNSQGENLNHYKLLKKKKKKKDIWKRINNSYIFYS